MATSIIRPTDRAAWLQHRQSGIGSSEVATIVGLNPYETPYQLWRRKKGLDPAKAETFAMRAGHYLEEAVASFWRDATGRETIKQSAGDWLIVSQDKPFLRVSPDRTYWLGEGRGQRDKGILECKTTQRTIDPSDPPKAWFCQLQYQLGVAELETGSLAWLTAGRSFDYIDVRLVPDFYGWLREEAERFWTDYILGDAEPPLTSATDVQLKWRTHTPDKVLEVGEGVYLDWCELKTVREELEALELRKAEYEDRLKLAFGDAEALAYQGQTLATWKAPTKPTERLDSKALKAAHPDLVARFTSSSIGARRLLIK